MDPVDVVLPEAAKVLYISTSAELPHDCLELGWLKAEDRHPLISSLHQDKHPIAA